MFFVNFVRDPSRYSCHLPVFFAMLIWPNMTIKNRGKRRYKGAFVFAVALFFFVSGAVILWTSTFKVPDLESFEQRKVTESTKIYDRTGKVLLYDIFSNIKRTIVPVDEISRHIKNATVAIEDSEFYEHRGIKPTAIIRATLVNIGTLEFSQGGSTITQQEVKNSILTTEKHISRKLKEWVLALKLERMMSKDKILEIYLNETPYGGSIYGVEEATQAFFGKSSRD